MNDNPRDTDPDSQTDRVILDYLNQILRDPATEAAAIATEKKQPVVAPVVIEAPRVMPDNIAAFDSTRVRKPETPPARAKVEARQPVTLPFRNVEKNRVLVSPALLNLPEQAPLSHPEPAPVAETAAAVVPSTGQDAAAEPEPAAEMTLPVALAPSQDFATPATAPAIIEDESTSAAAETLLPAVSEWHDNGRPAWAQERFECLIFNVAGLKLAVPLITLGAIHRIDRKFNALPHQSRWFLGILQTASAGNIKVLDTALCVMPERYDPASKESLGYVITIHGYNWGLACHEVERSITLDPDQVKWRTQRGKRPWLAGTVIDHMCALIDTDGFHDVIVNAEQGA